MLWQGFISYYEHSPLWLKILAMYGQLLNLGPVFSREGVQAAEIQVETILYIQRHSTNFLLVVSKCQSIYLFKTSCPSLPKVSHTFRKGGKIFQKYSLNGQHFIGEGIDERKLSNLCYILFNTVYTLEVISKESQI